MLDSVFMTIWYMQSANCLRRNSPSPSYHKKLFICVLKYRPGFGLREATRSI